MLFLTQQHILGFKASSLLCERVTSLLTGSALWLLFEKSSLKLNIQGNICVDLLRSGLSLTSPQRFFERVAKRSVPARRGQMDATPWFLGSTRGLAPRLGDSPALKAPE